MNSAMNAISNSFIFLFLASAFVSSFFLWPEIPIVLVMLSFGFYGPSIGFFVGTHGDYRIAQQFLLMLVSSTIVIFAVIYWQHGLLFLGVYRDVSFAEALYFSVTTLTTLGYGDFAPAPRVRLATSAQAILGYISLGTWVAINMGQFSSIARDREKLIEKYRSDKRDSENK